uniref:receptor-like protein kinase FERONIA n=1 Tax=Erigeron canadensis TaxID=72917 RepID=UPI001CB93FF4|nr:receptor-like protein kinase FERONIA [Erigeron canadensis]
MKMQKFELKVIQEATNNFELCIANDIHYDERIYEGELITTFGIPTRVLIKRYPEKSRRGYDHYSKFVDVLQKLHHPNYISFLGYCHEKREQIIVWEYPERGTLDQYISRRRSSNTTTSLTWLRRLEICAGVGRGLSYLHSQNLGEDSLKSASIFLDDKWVAKFGDIDISTQGSTGDSAYNSPERIRHGVHTSKTNVYCFGIILFEVLCGRLCSEEVDGVMLSAALIKDLYEKKKLDEIVDPALLREDQKVSSYSVDKYSSIAYQCLTDDYKMRPSMVDVVKELDEILSIEGSGDDHIQENSKGACMGRLLSIEPHELQFPFELMKEISISLLLKNKTDSHVAFKVKITKPNKYFVDPPTGVLLPYTTRDVTCTMRTQKEAPQDMECSDKFLLQSAVVSPELLPKDINRELFENKESSNQVEECLLNIQYVSPNPINERPRDPQ